MNELMTEMSSDAMNDSFYSDHSSSNQSLKRNSDSGESFNKRIRDDDIDNDGPIYHLNDSRLYEEEEEYREYTEEEMEINDISNHMINFSINMVTLEWDEYYLNRNAESPVRRPKPEIKFPLDTNDVNHGYFLESLVSASKRTAVYIGYSLKEPQQRLVIKIGFEMGFHSIENECNNYKKILKTSKAVPKLLDHLWWRSYPEVCTTIRWGLIVFEKCGPNLVDLMKRSSLGLIPSMSDMIDGIAVRMIDAIEAFHESGFIHCSLKPEHFLLESEDSIDLKLISLGASRRYLKESANGTEEHIEYQKDTKAPKGDPHFHSIGYHNGYRRSRADDMESLGYCMVYLMKGTLPWIDSSVVNLSSKKTINKIGKKMQSTQIDELCDGLSPSFSQYFELISNYKFADKPNYEELRKCFQKNAQ